MKFSRQQLYDLVWSKPITTIAKEHDISSHQLRNICNANHIPLPRAGHWMKLQNGKEVEIVALPEIADKEEGISLINETYQSVLGKFTKQIKGESDSLFKTPDKLTNPHELIQKAIESLKGKNRIVGQNILMGFQHQQG